jgi:hypothetical protein
MFKSPSFLDFGKQHSSIITMSNKRPRHSIEDDDVSEPDPIYFIHGKRSKPSIFLHSLEDDESHGGISFLEPYFEGWKLKHLNYSGPGNPITPEYIKNYPPIKYINGIRTHSDEIAFDHDHEYGDASKLPTADEQMRAIRAADIKFIKRHIEHRNDPAKLGLHGISAKVALENQFSRENRKRIKRALGPTLGLYIGGKSKNTPELVANIEK